MSINFKTKIVMFLSFLCFNSLLAMDDLVDNNNNNQTIKTADLSENKDSTQNKPKLLSVGRKKKRKPSQLSLIESQSTMDNVPVASSSNLLEKESNLFAQLNDAEIDFWPLLRAQRITKQAPYFIETFNFLVHNYLTPADVYVAEIAAISSPKQCEMFDWVTNGWKCAKWTVGTSQNIAAILIAAGGIAANFFKKKAVLLATLSAIIVTCGTFLSLVYDYCDRKRMHRLARNLVIMAIQAAREEEERNDEAATDDA